ncbi:hypothetical protein ABBQ38_010880 [Trebouxia sp. C0009 RCD-2024]
MESTRMVVWLVLCLVAASWRPTTAAPDYLAPIPAGSLAPCQDTAPDCMDVCGCDHTGIDFACRLSSPIGEYLRRRMANAMLLSSLTRHQDYLLVIVRSPVEGAQALCQLLAPSFQHLQ